MINLRYFCFVVIQLYLKVRALALFYFINLHHYTYITLVSVGDTSGLRFQCPSRCTGVQIKVNNTSGWANIDYFRCIAKYHHSEIHRNSKFSPNPDVFILISRDSTRFPSQHTPARVGFILISREYTCSPSQHIPARAGFTLISREYTYISSQYIPAQAGLTMICAEIRLELWLCYNRISSRL